MMNELSGTFKVIGTYDYEADNRMTEPSMPSKHQGMCSARYEQWAGAFGKPYSAALKSLKKKITHVSQEVFEGALNNTVEQFMANKPANFVAFVEPGKSQKWVTEIAMKYGLEASAYVALGEEGANALPYALAEIEPDDERFEHYVIVDDASYSGNQMANNISAANRTLRTKFAAVQPIFHVLIPFATTTALEKIGSLRQKGVNVQIYNSVTMPSVAQSIEKKDLKAVKDILWPGMDPGAQDRRAATTALHWFDHKIPNAMSFPEVLATGQVTKSRGAVPQEIPFLPPIHPPYKPKFDDKENIENR